MARRVPRGMRAVNGVALLLFLAGAAFYVRAWIGMHRLRSYEPAADAAAFSAMARFNHYWELSRIGIGLVLAAVAVAVIAAGATALLARRTRS